MQSGRATGVQPDPLRFATIHTDGHAHAAGSQLNRDQAGDSRFGLGRHNTDFVSFEINLNDAPTKEIGPKKAIYGLRTRGAEVLKVHCKVRRRQLDTARDNLNIFQSVAGESVFDATHIDGASEFEFQTLGSRRVQNADARAGVEQKIEVIAGLWNRGFNPEKTLTIFKRNFIIGRDGHACV